MRVLHNLRLVAVMVVGFGLAAPLRAQTSEHSTGDAHSAADSRVPLSANPLFEPVRRFDQVIQQPAGPPATPRHTGIKAMVKGLIVDFKYLPSRENLFWAGVGGG